MKTSSPPSSRAGRLARTCSGILLAASVATGCGDDASTPPGDDDVPCNGESSLNLPAGFCATVFADDIGAARHMAVTPSGDLFVATLEGPRGERGRVVALRDSNGDGVADRKEEFGEIGANGIAWRENVLYYAPNDRIVRYTLPDGELLPTEGPLNVATDLPNYGNHNRKSLAFDPQGDLLVNIGSATNACQLEPRTRQSPGLDPCPELDVRAGIWHFDGQTIEQTLADGRRFATGVRNGNAMATDPRTGHLWVAQNGRDSLSTLWPLQYPPEADARLPSEELFRITEGADYGWPYCYHDPILDEKVLAPEYGGNGYIIGRCDDVEEPDAILPAHWAPLGMHFYEGDMFPARYRGGLFVANHGSWHEPYAGEPPGYNVTFFPRLTDGRLGDYEIFADDFAGDERPLPDAAEYRPVSVAEAPDGSLYVSDDARGRIWRIYYRGRR